MLLVSTVEGVARATQQREDPRLVVLRLDPLLIFRGAGVRVGPPRAATPPASPPSSSGPLPPTGSKGLGSVGLSFETSTLERLASVVNREGSSAPSPQPAFHQRQARAIRAGARDKPAAVLLLESGPNFNVPASTPPAVLTPGTVLPENKTSCCPPFPWCTLFAPKFLIYI